MAKKFILFLLITFTGRTLQSSWRIPHNYITSGHTRVLFSQQKTQKCKFKLTSGVIAYKSWNCFRGSDLIKQIRHTDIQFVFTASKKNKPQRKNSMAYILLPLKNWGRIYYPESL